MGKFIQTHWMSNTSIYSIYDWVKQRCNNKNHKFYNYYGWRWIKCGWVTFEDFYKDMWNSYEKWLTIDRINNNLNYCKENCRWVTQKEQMRNTRRNVILEYKWELKTMAEWFEIYSIDYETWRKRLSNWWSLDNTLNKKINESKKFWINIKDEAKRLWISNATLYRRLHNNLYTNK